MRLRHLTALGLALLALAAPAANAATPARTVAPQVVDPKGDGPTGPLDVLSATISSPGGRAGEKLQLRLVLAEAPAATTPVDYAVHFWAGCTSYAVRLRWTGAAPASEATVSTQTCSTPSAGELTSTTITYRVDGTTVLFEVPLGPTLKVGAKLTSIAAGALVGGAYAGAIVTGTVYEVKAGDVGFGRSDYVIGSERARR